MLQKRRMIWKQFTGSESQYSEQERLAENCGYGAKPTVNDDEVMNGLVGLPHYDQGHTRFCFTQGVLTGTDRITPSRPSMHKEQREHKSICEMFSYILSEPVQKLADTMCSTQPN